MLAYSPSGRSPRGRWGGCPRSGSTRGLLAGGPPGRSLSGTSKTQALASTLPGRLQYRRQDHRPLRADDHRAERRLEDRLAPR